MNDIILTRKMPRQLLTANLDFTKIFGSNSHAYAYNQVKKKTGEPDIYSPFDSEDDRPLGFRNVSHFHQQSFSRLH